MTDVIDDPGMEIAVRPTVTLVPQTTAHDLVARLDVIRGAMQQAMQKDVDYGVIPGTGKKPTLLKPGAEKLAVLFQMDVQLENEKLWDDDGHLTVISRATVYHIPTGSRIASGEGMCSTREGKYAFRQSERFCPSCGVAAIIKGKAEYGGGFVCFKKKGGCGAKFRDDDEAIVSQPAGQVPNPNIADTYNTVDKMASKRARVDAILAATGASALFTQDVEDFVEAPPPATPAPAAVLPDTPITDEGEQVVLDFATEAQKKKLNVLVGKLRAGGKDPTQWIYDRERRAAVTVHRDDVGHWGPLRDNLTKKEAGSLIEALEGFVAFLPKADA